MDMGVVKLQNELNKALHTVFTPSTVDGKKGESYFVKARVVGNYNELYEKCKKLQKAKDNYANAVYVDERDNIESV